MSIKLACPRCQKSLNANDELAGKRAKCPSCGQQFVVPTPQAAPSAKATFAPPVMTADEQRRFSDAFSQVLAEELAAKKLREAAAAAKLRNNPQSNKGLVEGQFVRKFSSWWVISGPEAKNKVRALGIMPRNSMNFAAAILISTKPQPPSEAVLKAYLLCHGCGAGFDLEGTVYFGGIGGLYGGAPTCPSCGDVVSVMTCPGANDSERVLVVSPQTSQAGQLVGIIGCHIEDVRDL